MKKFSFGIVLALLGIIAFSLMMSTVKEGIENNILSHNIEEMIKKIKPGDIKLALASINNSKNR